MPRHRQPSRYRFVGSVILSLTALGAWLFLPSMFTALCRTTRQANCAPAPDLLLWIPLVLFLVCAVRAGYQFYRDWYHGDYLTEDDQDR